MMIGKNLFRFAHELALFPLFLVCWLPNRTPVMAAECTVTPGTIEEKMGIYLLNKERRSNQDKVLVGGDGKGYTAEVSYWRSLQSRDPAEEICNAYKWVLFGRSSYGVGATQLFDQFPCLSRLELKFFDVETGTKLGKKKGEVLPTTRIIQYMKVGVERKSLMAKKADWKDVEEQMNKGKCAEMGNRYLDSKWFDEAYLKQGK